MGEYADTGASRIGSKREEMVDVLAEKLVEYGVEKDVYEEETLVVNTNDVETPVQAADGSRLPLDEDQREAIYEAFQTIWEPGNVANLKLDGETVAVAAEEY